MGHGSGGQARPRGHLVHKAREKGACECGFKKHACPRRDLWLEQRWRGCEMKGSGVGSDQAGVGLFTWWTKESC